MFDPTSFIPGFSWLKVGAGLAIVAAIGLAYWHYTSILDDREELRVENSQLATQVETERQVNNQLRSAVMDWQLAHNRVVQTMNQLQEVNREASQRIKELNDTLKPGRLERVVKAKPQLVEGIVNRGTADVGRVLRETTGGGDGANPATP